MAALLTANAAIMVGPTGSTLQTFAAQPPGTDWSTGSIGGNAAAYTQAGLLDAALRQQYAEYFQMADANFPARLGAALGSSGTQPPSPANIARRNTSASLGQYVQIRPNNDRAAVVLLATLQNDTGGTVRYLNVSYTFGLAVAAGSVAAEEIPGWRAFYSMDGEADTWQAIPQFTTGTPGDLTASLDVGEWAHGSTMFIMWADDEAAAHTTAPNHEGAYTLDNFLAEPSAGRGSSLTSFRSTALGWEATFEDGTGPFVLNASSFTGTLNGTAITPTVVKNGDVVTVSYTTPLQNPGSSHDLVLNYTDSNTPAEQFTLTRTYVVNPYQVIPASAAATGVDTTSSGFKARVHQILGARYPGDRNSSQNAERQLANLIMEPGTSEPYMDLAFPSQEADGRYTIPMVNWNQAAPGTSEGNFTSASTPSRPDEPILGLDGVSGNDNIVGEFMTYLDLRAGVVYTMGVNSDDGFKVTAGQNPRDQLSMLLGSFEGGRGFADTTFDFMVAADGIYPFRLLWWEGTGGASVEWFTVNPDGSKVLLNDREVASHVKAYSVGPALIPYIQVVSPGRGETNAPANLVLELYIEDGATTVSPGGIQLFVNDVNQTANATITKVEGSTRTLVTYDPPGDLAPETRLNVRIAYTDSASVTRGGEYFVQVKARVLVAMDGVWRAHLQLDETGATPILRLRAEDLGTAWRQTDYVDSDANGWVNAAALIADETGATAEPIRTPVSRIYDPVNAPTTSAMTLYTRTTFNFDGLPGSSILLLRHVVDDGAVFYLNGVELHRFGIGATVNPVLYTTGSGGNENASRGNFIVPRAALRTGLNILAVETHQDANTSSDIVFGAELTVVTDPNATPARISSTTPNNGAVNVRNMTPISVNLEDGSTSVDATTVRLLINGEAVTGATVSKPPGGILTTINYTPTTPYTENAVTTVTVEFRDNNGVLRTENFTFTVLPRLLVDIDATQMWRIHMQRDESGATPILRLRGEDLGTAWRDAAYEDTDANGWLSGAAMFGDETGATAEPLRTPLSRIYDPVGGAAVSAMTMYARTHFNFTGDPATAELRIRHALDDGAVIYLNGVELHRFWMAEGEVLYTTAAGVGFTPTDHENVYEGPFDVPSTALRQGDNVLAVEVHQNGSGSSDIVFGMQLMWMNPGVVVQPRPVMTTSYAGGVLTINWSNNGTLESIGSLPASPTNPWVSTGNSSGTAQVTIPAGPGMQFYRINRAQ